MNGRRQSGFSLLEAMVAITVLTSVSFAVFSWINQSARVLMRSESVMAQELLVSDLLTELDLIDLRTVTEGDMERDGIRLHWQSGIVNTRQGKTRAGGTGFYDHSLNEVKVFVYRDDLQVDDFRVYVVSSVLARQPSESLRL